MNNTYYHVQDIQWDCDTPDELDSLPIELGVFASELDIEIPSENGNPNENEISDDKIEEAISKYLTETYFYCHNGFTWYKM